MKSIVWRSLLILALSATCASPRMGARGGTPRVGDREFRPTRSFGAIAADARSAVPFGLSASDWAGIRRAYEVRRDPAAPINLLPFDPVAQQAYLKASNTDADDQFGYSVAVSGDTVVVGAPAEDSNATGVNGDQTDNSASNSGAVYVFTRIGDGWSQQAYLKASNTEADDLFGLSVAVSGDTVVVGAPTEDSNATGVNGDQTDNSASNSGAVYVFTRIGDGWSQQAYLKASNTGRSDQFGSAVAVSVDTIVVGARDEGSSATGVDGDQANDNASEAGAAYVFTRVGGIWSQQAYLKASNTYTGDSFGFAVSISGDLVVIGAPDEDSNASGINSNATDRSAGSAGAAYVFSRSGTIWSPAAYLKASNTGANDRFGYSVAISDDTVVVGARLEDSSALGVNGDQSDNSLQDAGAAYVFTRAAGSWSQQAYLKASNTNIFAGFGFSIAASGATIVVGGGDASGGAAYTFVRSGGVWSQRASLKASNLARRDGFSLGVAVSGETVVVGALREDSSATGVNGDEADNSAVDAGAAYIFTIADTAPPTVICDDADLDWHAANVSLSCNAEDEGSGLAQPADENFVLTTTVADGIESLDAATDEREVCDVADNCVTIGPIAGNRIDRRAPDVTISAPLDHARFTLGQYVLADYECTDNGADVDSCGGPVGPGEEIDTATPGLHTFEVIAEDAVGNARTVSTSYTVVLAPAVSWPPPAAISYGTALGASQLNATASVAGSFVYSPPPGTVLNVGPNQTLSVTFTPQDTNSYDTVTAYSAITVLRASSATTVVSVLNPSVAGNLVAFTATVTIANGVPTGFVRFESSTQGVIGFAVLDGTGNASMRTLGLSAGTHDMTGTYLGDASFLTSASAPLSQVVTAGTRFAALPPSPTGWVPWALAAADLNGDGRLDAVTTNVGDGTLSIFLGAGDGTFAPAASYPAGSGPIAIDAGDVTGDGLVDLVVSNQQAATTDLWRGNGDGTFQPRTTIASVQGLVLVRDVNGDGTSDVIIGYRRNCCASYVGTLLSSGNGTFQPLVESPGRDGQIAAGDFNGDGHVDVAASSFNGNEVQLLIGNGDGSFTPGLAYPVSRQPSGITAADVNGDGHVDVLVLSTEPTAGQYDVVNVLIGHGDGTLDPPATYPVGSGALSVALFDVEGDGIIDLAVTSRNTGKVTVLSGNGGGTFRPGVAYAAGSGPTGLATGDLNGDGAADIVITDVDADGLVVLLNTGGVEVTVDADRASAPSGEPVVFTAHVAPTINQTSAPTGVVAFRDGAVVLGSAAMADGQASLTTSMLAAGTRTITATYGGDANFSVRAASTQVVVLEPLGVTVVSPNGGGKVFANVPVTIRWAVTSATSISVALSRNGGTSYTTIGSCTGLPGAATSCSWTPAGPGTSNARIRVTATGAGGTTAADASDTPFTIATNSPSISVTAPNTALIWAVGSARALTWNHNLGAGSSVRIELTRDGGSTWEVIAPSVANATATTGSHPWPVTGPVTTNALIRVSWTDGATSDVSNTAFSIDMPAIDVTAPDTNVNWIVGSRHDVKWNHNLGTNESVVLDVSRDGGSTWTPLTPGAVANSANTSGSVKWDVVGPVTTAGRVRVTWVRDGAVQSQSSANFRISSRIAVTSPNTALTWGAGSTRTITWNHDYDLSQTFDIAFSADNGSTWTSLASGVPAQTATTGIHQVRLPGTITTQALIRVSPLGEAGDGDVSNVPFKLDTPVISISAPKTNVNWTINSARAINWTHNLGQLEHVHIEVSRDGGATWATIQASLLNSGNTSSTFNWQPVTGPATTMARIRVTWVFDGTVLDMSPVNFRIQ